MSSLARAGAARTSRAAVPQAAAANRITERLTPLPTRHPGRGFRDPARSARARAPSAPVQRLDLAPGGAPRRDGAAVQRVAALPHRPVGVPGPGLGQELIA